MNMKKLISSVSALALAASAFAGITASAYNVSLSAETTVPGYTNGTFYNFQTNEPEVLPTSGDLRFRSGGAYGLHNFGSGSRSGTASIAVNSGDILLVEAYNTSTSTPTVTINCGTANTALTTSTGYTVFDITSGAESVTFTVNRYTGIMGALVMEKDTSAATADYITKFVDEDGNEVKPEETATGVVGATITVDTSSFVDESGQKYLYVSDDSDGQTIAADGPTIVTVVYKAAATYSYTAVANGDVVLTSGTGAEGDSITVAYPRYINVDGTLYSKGVTNKEYNIYNNILDEDNKIIDVGAYTATDITNVVFLAEGEDIEGLTASTAANVAIRSSKSGAAYATEDTVITSLPAGKYQVYGVLFAGSSAGANLSFALGDNEFSFATTNNTNWEDVSTEEITINDAADLVFKTSGGRAAALDYIYVVKTGDAEPEPAKVKVTVADGDAEPAVTEIEAGAEFTLPEAAGKEGYTFDGWSDGENTVPAGTVVKPEADVTYTAVYTLIPVVVDPTIVVTDGETYTEDDGNPAKTFTADVTAGTYTITGLTWIAKSGETSKPADEAIEVNLSTGTNVVIGLVVEAATVDVSTITADVTPSYEVK